MQNRQLQTWLSEDEYAQLEAEWQAQPELRENLKEKLSDYSDTNKGYIKPRLTAIVHEAASLNQNTMLLSRSTTSVKAFVKPL